MAPVRNRIQNNKKSNVGTFYDVDPNDQTLRYCKLCKKKIGCGKKVGRLCTGNLKIHLERYHSAEFDAAYDTHVKEIKKRGCKKKNILCACNICQKSTICST